MLDVKNMTPEQRARFGSVVDSRVRLLGESYSRAYDAVEKDGADNKAWIMGEES